MCLVYSCFYTYFQSITLISYLQAAPYIYSVISKEANRATAIAANRVLAVGAKTATTGL